MWRWSMPVTSAVRANRASSGDPAWNVPPRASIAPKPIGARKLRAARSTAPNGWYVAPREGRAQGRARVVGAALVLGEVVVGDELFSSFLWPWSKCSSMRWQIVGVKKVKRIPFSGSV
jgi:hypothetical protein